MAGRSWRLLVALLLLLVAAAFLRAQNAGADRSSDLAPNLAQLRYSPVATPLYLPRVYIPSPVSADSVAFRRIVHSASIIFSGWVIATGHDSSIPGRSSQSSTTVCFHVEHAIRGAYPGEKLVIHEWAGLRERGEYYRAGERVFLFLYPPGKLGLTSPVAGTAGRFAMNARGEIVVDALQAQVLAANPLIGAKTRVPYSEFARIVRLSSGKE
jgi:hypothetical protein